MARIPIRLSGNGRGSALPEPQGADGFLLSLVDGVLTESELGFVTGQSPSELATSLERLARTGLIGFQSAQTRAPSASVPPTSGDDDEPGVDLDAARRRAIRELYDKLERLDHYGVLGVSPSATKGQIRAAYHRLAPNYHPDRHFRKNLGSYKKRIEAIFARVTQAYEALRKDARSDPPPPPGERTSVPPPRDSSPSGARATSPAGGPISSRPSAPSFERIDTPARPPYVPAARSAADAAAAERTRRDALARKLGAAAAPRPSQPARPSVPAPRPSSPPPAAEPRGERVTHTRVKPPESDPPRAPAAPEAPYRLAESVAPSAAELLRQRYDEVADKARALRRERLVARARAASSRGDHAAAAEDLATASALSPNDPELRRLAREAEQRAAGARVKS